MSSSRFVPKFPTVRRGLPVNHTRSKFSRPSSVSLCLLHAFFVSVSMHAITFYLTSVPPSPLLKISITYFRLSEVGNVSWMLHLEISSQLGSIHNCDLSSTGQLFSFSPFLDCVPHGISTSKYAVVSTFSRTTTQVNHTLGTIT